MIECVKENIWYKKKRIKAPKKAFAFFLVFIIFLSVVLYYKFVVTERIFQICTDYTRTYSAMSVNSAVLDNLTDNVKYTDLITIEKNNDGDIVLMSANSYKANLLSREIVEFTDKYLRQKLEGGIPVPLLAFLGIEVISGYGRTIDYKSVFVSSVECEFLSDFKSVGINQTLHSIYVKVTCTVNMQTFLSKRTEILETPILISETVLVGKVPETYLNGKLFG